MTMADAYAAHVQRRALDVIEQCGQIAAVIRYRTTENMPLQEALPWQLDCLNVTLIGLGTLIEVGDIETSEPPDYLARLDMIGLTMRLMATSITLAGIAATAPGIRLAECRAYLRDALETSRALAAKVEAPNA
jgi:hypothetical protein